MSRSPQDSSRVTRPAWVALAPRLRMDDGEHVLRMDDAAHARLLRQLAARALHEPLLACLAERPAASPAVVAAARALRALLPGSPKPVAALTRAPEVIAPLLGALNAPTHEREAACDVLAATVLFALALTQHLRVSVQLVGPLTLVHGPTRRGLALRADQRLQLGPGEISLDDHPLDPWGSALAHTVSTYGRLWTPLTNVARLPPPDVWDAVLRAVAPGDSQASVVHELFDAVTVDDRRHTFAEVDTGRRPAWDTALPSALGCLRVPRADDATAIAHALLREGVLHRLLVLRLVDPLVRDERALPLLIGRADAWARARLTIEPMSQRPCVVDSELTTLGAMVARELDARAW
ncbi:MAG: hypothetical protein H6726_24520 [Sandaracinaceae bacterium]|nr:hypothetical protein [Sandaracinaceae bacterium]